MRGLQKYNEIQWSYTSTRIHQCDNLASENCKREVAKRFTGWGLSRIRLQSNKQRISQGVYLGRYHDTGDLWHRTGTEQQRHVKVRQPTWNIVLIICCWCIEDQAIRYLILSVLFWFVVEKITDQQQVAWCKIQECGVLLLDLLVWRKQSTSFVSIFWTMMALEKALVRYLSYMPVWYCWWKISCASCHQLRNKYLFFFPWFPFLHPRVVLSTISSKQPRHQWWLCQIWSAVWRSTSFHQGLHNRWTDVDT